MKIRISILSVLVLACNTALGMNPPKPPAVPHSSRINEQSKAMAIQLRLFVRDMVGLSLDNTDLSLDTILEKHTQTITYLIQNPDERTNILTAANLGSLQNLPTIIPSYTDILYNTLQPTSTTFSLPSSQESLKKITDVAITKIDFNTITDLSTLTTREDGIKLDNYPASIQTVIKDILSKYLNNLPLQMKKKIIMAYLEQDPNASQEELMAAVLLEVGPIIQKLFQLIGQSTTSASLKKTMSTLQTQLKPVPLEVSKKIISTSLGQDFSLFAQATFKNLGAASIAQAILVKTPSGEEFVIKVLKPGIPEKIQLEYDILMHKVVTQPAGKEKIKQIYTNIVEELDFRSEAKYLQQGQLLYQYCQDNGVITTPSIPKGNFIHQQVLVMSKAPGKALSDLTAPETQSTKLLALYQFYFLWLREALFESGFFHGDTHAGNLFLDIKNNKTHRFTLTPIDFGACAQLNQQEQANIILLTLGLELNIPYFVATAVAQLATNRYDKTALEAQLQVFLTVKNVPSKDGLNEISQKVKYLFAQDKQQWGMNEKIAAFSIATELIKLCTTLENTQSDPSKYTQFMESVDTLNIQLPASFNLFVRGQRFLEGQINTILQEQKVSGEQFYNSLFSKLSSTANPLSAIPKFFSPFSKNIILNLIMSGLQKYLKNMPCTLV